jgi:hypothetical protein
MESEQEHTILKLVWVTRRLDGSRRCKENPKIKRKSPVKGEWKNSAFEPGAARVRATAFPRAARRGCS